VCVFLNQDYVFVSGAAAYARYEMLSRELIAVMDQYLDSLVANDPTGLPVAQNFKVTENGYSIELGQGLFETAVEVTYKQYMADPSAGQVAILGVVKESILLANFMVRLKVEYKKITEIETFVAREGESSVANPKDMITVNPIYDTVLKPFERLTRRKMIQIANSYFEGIEKGTTDVPFHPDCNRYENGFQTTNNPPNFAITCKEQFDIELFSYIKQVRNRRYLMTDVEKGLVFALVIFDIQGKKEDFDNFPIPFEKLPSRIYKPRSMFLAEIFKIVDGQILSIEAMMVNAPLGATSGWEITGK